MNHAPLFYVVAGVFWLGMASVAVLVIALASRLADRWQERDTRMNIQSALDGLGSRLVQ